MAIGFHASHEQVHPSVLLEAVQRAEAAGFDGAMCSDHLAPWSERQGQSAFAWSWLGAALQSTSLAFGIVNAPGQRYHPAIIAQAIATLSSMYPGRFWAALGTGEAVNEHVTGDRWPRKELRNRRLRECVDVIRALLAGEEVSHDGLVTVDRARVWTLPEVPPRLVLQLHVSYAATDGAALAIAHDQWRSNVFPPPLCWDLDSVETFDAAAAHVTAQEMHGSVLASSDPMAHAEALRGYLDLGFDDIYVHHVGKEQKEFIDAYGEKVLVQL